LFLDYEIVERVRGVRFWTAVGFFDIDVFGSASGVDETALAAPVK
jgi:hypothetical protein